MHYVLLENIRSAYNVGNIIRTADALGRWVITTGYSPHPSREPKVIKTSLGAEQTIPLLSYSTSQDALQEFSLRGYILLAAELWANSLAIDRASDMISSTSPYLIVLGNEVLGVEEDTLASVHHSIYIPMQGAKESLNVWQAAAIIMRQINHW